jgi:cytochrome c oxidase subunit III
VSATAAYLALAAGVIVWALLVRKFTAKPWEAGVLETGVAENLPNSAPARVGLWVFLAVVTSLFGLFMSAYYMRMGHGHGELHDWHALAEPSVLWINSALLIVASGAMQWSRASIARRDTDRARDGLLVGGLLTIAFLAGQLFAWREIKESGLLTPSNPAVAFFYVLTAVHGLHLLGGLVVWGRTLLRMLPKRPEPIDVRLSIELCTVYWHYLLLVWLALFALLIST